VTGAKQWAAAFDYTPVGIVGAPAHAVKFGVYGALAEPVVDGNDLYVLDMQNRRSQYLKKYDRMTGKLLWTSPEIKEAKAIPGMWVADGKVVLQIGGMVETQAYIYWRETTPDGYVIHEEWRVQYRNVKPVGLQAFNTTDGTLAWDSERFRKGITNCLLADDRLYVCSGKSLYCIDHKTGTDVYEVALGDDNVGLANRILPYKDMVVIVGEKGVATHTRSSGALAKSNKYKSSDMESQRANMLLMKTDNSDIAAFQLDDCSFKQFNARKGSVSTLSYDGEYVYVYEKKEVTKLRTR
ncbi:MAG TPA: PQQ-binding-like beta-propeller repeat protein, partial [Flavobacteriales bacterium]|nr:PQQ-binding-like beta-propeller repeat protein [Flavobacteriales bacterium]